MNWLKLARWAMLGIVGLGASALTLGIVFIPDLTVSALSALIAARIAFGLANWLAVLMYGRSRLLASKSRRSLAIAR